MLTPSDARRRWFGAFFLFLSIGMLVWGTTLISDYLVKHPAQFIIFWGTCALFTGLALINALCDMMIMRRRTREEQIALAQRSFSDLDLDNNKRP